MIARLLLALAGTALGLLLVEGICRLGVEDEAHTPETLWGSALLPKDPDDLRAAARVEAGYRYLAFDRDLGWTIAPNVVVAPGERLDDDVSYRSDADGLRIGSRSHAVGDRSEDLVAPSRRTDLRIAAFGDSFTHCDEVELEACWTHRLERMLGTRVFNAGVPGYGTDQAYLRHLALRARLAPDVVVLGLMVGDIKRNVNVFRVFLGGWTARTKPRFVLVGDRLERVNHPAAAPEDVPRLIAREDPLLAYDGWYDPAEWRRDALSWSVAWRFARARLHRPPERPSYYAYDSEPTVVTARIVEAFARDVEAAGGRFLCVVMPSEEHLRYADPVPWRPLLDRLGEAGVEVVDTMPALRALVGTPGLFRPQGHYGSAANAAVADSVRAAIERPVAARVSPVP